MYEQKPLSIEISPKVTSLFRERKVLLCQPEFYGIHYEINPWMDTHNTVHQVKALQQWHILHHTLIRLGCWVDYLKPEKGLPDMCFTANGALVRNRKAVLPRFVFKERQGEAIFFKQWFFERGYEILGLKEGNFEGEGDALFLGDKLIEGFGFRSDASVYASIKSFLEVETGIPVQLIDPFFYHLDTCFCPLTSDRALIYKNAVAPNSFHELEKVCELFPVPENEARRFCCNSVVIEKNIIIPSGCPVTEAYLEKSGFNVYPIELDEFIKAGGAAKCLTLFV
jgi:N-dimethylarginine dimethylaminohydrolase